MASAWIWSLIAFAAVLAIVLRWAWKNFEDEIRSLSRLGWLAWCWLYTIRWRLRFLLRSRFFQGAGALLFSGSLYIFLHLGIAFVLLMRGHQTETEPPNETETILDNAVALLPALPELPVWFDAVLVVIAGLVLWHHWKEWDIRKRESAAPADLAKLVTSCRPFLISNQLTKEQQAEFFKIAMGEMATILKIGRRKQNIVISLTSAAGQQQLSVAHVYPSNATDVDRQVKLALASSAAGLAFTTKVPIYVPSTRHLGGINMTTYRSVGLVYGQESKTEPGPSLMCVPIVKDAAASTAIAVINVSSDRRNAFGPVDFDIVSLTAALMTEADWVGGAAEVKV